ncbi:hypothetical protein EB796_021964 [Bugula neritina]|uniref:AMP-dependent synthetase/ligase domain-containing protein n=1 Tax=Bugula neritina TaxID=10212 RepID=A0A7J7J1W8_BUGNE|nr:hypothetical protein EB796_021964 [Bugula neritina]
MSEPLTKSYVNTHDPEHPVQEDLVLYQLFEKARKEGNDGELLSLEDMGRMTASQVYDKADGYAKGLLALGLTPGEDILTVVGVPTLEAACLFTAATSIGVGYAHPYIYAPMEATISRIVPLLESKVLVAGEGRGGHIFTALLSQFDDVKEEPSSSVLPDVKHMFYDNSYKDRSPTQKFINNLDKLRQYGESISDQQLEEARKSVKPEHIMHHLFSSVLYRHATNLYRNKR